MRIRAQNQKQVPRLAKGEVVGEKNQSSPRPFSFAGASHQVLERPGGAQAFDPRTLVSKREGPQRAREQFRSLASNLLTGLQSTRYWKKQSTR